eukprot:GHVH01000725.1.p1 GENE.GHVH01000725.1~~GHVH01000725.1.p1  ORF type:complete len:665 (-),score=87.09 GHVH01000725.1:164-2158(-)
MESATFNDVMIRQPRLRSQLEHDDFTFFKKHQVSGWNTVPNTLAVESGLRDHEFQISLPINNRGDLTSTQSTRQHAQANGYWTGQFIDRWYLWTLYSDGGPRAVADVDGAFLALCHEKVRMQLGHANITPDTDWCIGGGTAGQFVASEIEHMILATDQPAWVYASLDVISHEANNNSSQDSAILSLLRGPARDELLSHSLVVLFGDHGHRTTTSSSRNYAAYAWYNSEWEREQYHPFLAIHLPDVLTDAYPHLLDVFGRNQSVLTSHVDLYETVMDVIYNRYPIGDPGSASPATAPLLVRFPNLRIKANDPISQGRLFSYLGQEWSSGWVRSKSNCDFSDLRPSAPLENKLLGRSAADMNFCSHPYIHYSTDISSHHCDGSPVECNQPTSDLSCIESILSEKHEDSYYSDSMLGNHGYHAWGDGGISLLYPLDSERGCEAIGIPSEMCICDPSNQVIYLNRDNGELDATGKSMYDYYSTLQMKRGTANQFWDRSILKQIAPDEDFGRQIFTPANVQVKNLLALKMSSHCIDVFLDVPVRILSGHRQERESDDKTESDDRCAAHDNFNFIFHLEKRGLTYDDDGEKRQIWKLYFVSYAGSTFRVILTIPGLVDCSLNGLEPLNADDVRYTDPPRFDRYDITSQCVDDSWPWSQRWKQICVCKYQT